MGNTHGSLLCSVIYGTEREGRRMTNDRRQKTEAREMVGLIVFGVAHLSSTFVTKHIYVPRLSIAYCMVMVVGKPIKW